MSRIRVTIRMLSDDAFELKAQALNRDPRLIKAGIAALKFVGNKKYIVDGEFSATSRPSSDSKQDSQPVKKVNVRIRMKADDAYQLVAEHLNEDPRLKEAGILAVNLAKELPVAAGPVETEKPKPGKYLKWVLSLGAIGVIIAAGIYAFTLFSQVPPVAPIQPVATTVIVVPADTSTSIPASTIAPARPTATSAPATKTPTENSPTATMTETATLEPQLSCQPMQAEVVSDLLACRYGPGAAYLYRSAYSKGNKLQVLGQEKTANGVWVYVESQGVKCWVNSSSKFVELNQDLACLESYYPEKTHAPYFNTGLFPAPINVEADRSGDLVNISWYWVGNKGETTLAPGDRESTDSPRFLLELWTCQSGEIVFTALGTGTYDETETYAQVKDEAGCSEPSHGDVYLAHRDGYVGPSVIPWPQP